MKCAILISGYLRNYKYSSKGLYKCVLNKLDCDIFIYTSRLNSMRTGHYNIITDEEKLEICQLYNGRVKAFAFCDEETTYHEEINKAYLDYDKRIENFQPSSNNVPYYDINTRKANSHGPLIDQYYKLYKCNELRKKYQQDNNVKYDLIFRIRADMVLDFTIDYSLLSIHPNILYLRNSDGRFSPLEKCNDIICQHKPFNQIHWFCAENFFFGGTDSIDKICSRFYNEIGHFQYLYASSENDETQAPEIQFAGFIEKYNFNVIFLNLNHKFIHIHSNELELKCNFNGEMMCYMLYN